MKKKMYTPPTSEEVEFKNEGVFCMSDPAESDLEQWDYTEFEW